MKIELELNESTVKAFKAILEEKASANMPMNVATAILSGKDGGNKVFQWQQQQWLAKELLKQLFS